MFTYVDPFHVYLDLNLDPFHVYLDPFRVYPFRVYQLVSILIGLNIA